MEHLQTLAARVRSGDSGAARQLRRELEGGLPSIVRRTMQTRRATSSLGRRILAEAARLTSTVWDRSPEGQVRLVDLIARRVCDCVIDNLWASHRKERGLLDTVCH
jgi:hypothetical protein